MGSCKRSGGVHSFICAVLLTVGHLHCSIDIIDKIGLLLEKKYGTFSHRCSLRSMIACLSMSSTPPNLQAGIVVDVGGEVIPQDLSGVQFCKVQREPSGRSAIKI